MAGPGSEVGASGLNLAPGGYVQEELGVLGPLRCCVQTTAGATRPLAVVPVSVLRGVVMPASALVQPCVRHVLSVRGRTQVLGVAARTRARRVRTVSQFHSVRDRTDPFFVRQSMHHAGSALAVRCHRQNAVAERLRLLPHPAACSLVDDHVCCDPLTQWCVLRQPAKAVRLHGRKVSR